jgi:putative lipoprotein
MHLAGELRFREPPPDLRDATVRVRLLDVSRADASAETVAEQTIEGPSVEPDDDGGSVKFALEAPELDARRSYSLAAHVDLSGSGEIEPGDFLTMESVPVDRSSERGRFEVPVRPVHR